MEEDEVLDVDGKPIKRFQWLFGFLTGSLGGFEPIFLQEETGSDENLVTSDSEA